MIIDPEKKYHRWQIGHMSERIEEAPQGPGFYRCARVWLDHKFLFAGWNCTKVMVDIELLRHAKFPERLFRIECKTHAMAMRAEAREILAERIKALFGIKKP